MESKPKYGGNHKKPHTEETKRLMSAVAKKKGFGKWMVGKKHTLKTRKKMSAARKGKNGSNWKGGLTKKTQLIRISLEYKLWRTAVFERDNYTCVWCGAKCGNGKAIYLEADHIKPFAHYPELRFAIDNGRTLCKECHRKTHTFGRRCFKQKNGIEI